MRTAVIYLAVVLGVLLVTAALLLLLTTPVEWRSGY